MDFQYVHFGPLWTSERYVNPQPSSRKKQRVDPDSYSRRRWLSVLPLRIPDWSTLQPTSSCTADTGSENRYLKRLYSLPVRLLLYEYRYLYKYRYYSPDRPRHPILVLIPSFGPRIGRNVGVRMDHQRPSLKVGLRMRRGVFLVTLKK